MLLLASWVLGLILLLIQYLIADLSHYSSGIFLLLFLVISFTLLLSILSLILLLLFLLLLLLIFSLLGSQSIKSAF